VLAPDGARTILVVSDSGEVAVALRERTDRAYAIIKDVRPNEAVEAFATCVPWPWMVVGDVPSLAPTLIDALRRHPILILWRGRPPDGLPRHTRGFTGFAALAAAATEALQRTAAGMRLAIGVGVELPGGGYTRSAELEALVASHPRPLDLPLNAFRSAARALSTRRIPCRPVWDSSDGTVSLVPGAIRELNP